jgi:hypothetical protein
VSPKADASLAPSDSWNVWDGDTGVPPRVDTIARHIGVPAPSLSGLELGRF